MSSTWVIRAGKGGAFVDRFLEQKYVGIDFNVAAIGALGSDVSKERILVTSHAFGPMLSNAVGGSRREA